MISQDRLQEGWKKGKDLVLRLFDENEFFYRQGQYSTSISISILIKEELTKLNLIRSHIKTNSCISKKEWDSISKQGSHTFKLKKLYVDALENVNVMGKDGYDNTVKIEKNYGSNEEFKNFSEINTENELISKRLEALNKIKQACWYLDWQNSKWITLSSLYSNKELELFSNYHLQIIGHDIVNEILDYKYPLDFYHKVVPQVSLLRNDPLWKNKDKFYELLKNEDFKKIIMVACNILDNFPNKATINGEVNLKSKDVWPIPKKDLLNGAILALKNAKKLLRDSQYACKNDRYSIALTLAVLSFEEFGKHFMIRKYLENNQTITQKIWFSEFTNHTEKLNAMLNYLETIVESQEKKKFDQNVTELSTLIKNWGHNKLNAIYLNWSKKNDCWYTFDDLDLPKRKKEAELAIDVIERFFTIYVDETRNPNFLTIEELADLIKSNKLSLECVDCNNTLKLRDEMIVHEKNYPEHKIAFHFS